MTNSKDEVEYVAMCYCAWGRADSGIDALVSMVKEHGPGFGRRGEKMMVAFHKGKGIELEFAHGQALVHADEKISDSTSEMSTETLERLHTLQQDLSVEAEALIRDSGVWEDIESSEQQSE